MDTEVIIQAGQYGVPIHACSLPSAGGIGQLECATVFSPVQAALGNEIGAMVRRFMRSPEIDEASLNWSEMSSIRVGGQGGPAYHRGLFREGRDDLGVCFGLSFSRYCDLMPKSLSRKEPTDAIDHRNCRPEENL